MASRSVHPIRYTKAFFHRVTEDEIFGLSAQLAYYFLLSLFPFLIFSLALLSYLGISSDQVLGLVESYAPEEAFHLIKRSLPDILDVRHGYLLSFGVLATIWSASNAINAIIRGLNRAYKVKESRNFFLARGMAILLTIAMIVIIIVALVLPVFGDVIGDFIFSHLQLEASNFEALWYVLRWLFSFLLIVVVISCLYYFAPNKKLSLKDVLIGAVIAAVGWQVASLGFSYYVGNFSAYSATYGSLGGIIILMIWFYLTAMIILMGGEINATNHYLREGHD